jgi:hypothetical protein
VLEAGAQVVEGQTLAPHVGQRGAMPPADAVALFGRIGDAVAAAHAAGALHRDGACIAPICRRRTRRRRWCSCDMV